MASTRVLYRAASGPSSRFRTLASPSHHAVRLPTSAVYPILIRPFFASSDRRSDTSLESSVSVSDSSQSILDQLSEHLVSHPIEPLSYTSAVILATLFVRSTTTLPISVWSRLRTDRFESIVMPKFKKFRTNLALNAKRKFLDSSQIALYQAHLQDKLKKELKRLISENKCKPSTTILVSLGVHVPVIYTLTTILRDACQKAPPGSPLALEQSPILGQSLLEPDLGLALICWAGFLVNFELNASFRHLRRSTETTNQPSKSNVPSSATSLKNDSFLSRGLSFWNPQKIRTASFLAGIGMMGLSASQPALVVMYWLTSNCFSILQSLCFIYLDYRQKNLKSKSTDLSQKEEEGKADLINKRHKSTISPKLNSQSSSSSLPPIL